VPSGAAGLFQIQFNIANSKQRTAHGVCLLLSMIELNLNPPKKDLRFFAAGQVIFFAIISWMVYGRTGSFTPWPATIFAVSAVVGVVGWLVPSAIRWIYAVWMIAVFPIGWVVSSLVMAIAWYFVITPIALILRARGHDALNQTFDAASETYWTTREQHPDSKRYFKQF